MARGGVPRLFGHKFKNSSLSGSYSLWVTARSVILTQEAENQILATQKVQESAVFPCCTSLANLLY